MVSDESDVAGSPVEPDRDWVWREDGMQALVSGEDADGLFVSGCAPNMRPFLPPFDHVVLLRAPREVVVARLATRTHKPDGKHPDHVARAGAAGNGRARVAARRGIRD